MLNLDFGWKSENNKLLAKKAEEMIKDKARPGD
jgi:hypothetical protein